MLFKGSNKMKSEIKKEFEKWYNLRGVKELSTFGVVFHQLKGLCWYRDNSGKTPEFKSVINWKNPLFIMFFLTVLVPLFTEMTYKEALLTTKTSLFPCDVNDKIIPRKKVEWVK